MFSAILSQRYFKMRCFVVSLICCHAILSRGTLSPLFWPALNWTASQTLIIHLRFEQILSTHLFFECSMACKHCIMDNNSINNNNKYSKVGSADLFRDIGCKFRISERQLRCHPNATYWCSIKFTFGTTHHSQSFATIKNRWMKKEYESYTVLTKSVLP